MKYVIDYGNARTIFTDLEKVSEEFVKLFRFMLYLHASEARVGKTQLKIVYN